MKKMFEKIADTCRSLKMELLAACLIVLLFFLLSGPGPAKETATTAASSGADPAGQETESDAREPESGTEARTEGMSESESETLTPAELAALESEAEETKESQRVEAAEKTPDQTETADLTETPDQIEETDPLEETDQAETEALTDPITSTEPEDSDKETPILLAKMPSIPVDFQIPMAMPDPEIVEYRGDSSADRWQLADERYRIGGVIPYIATDSPSSAEEGYEIVGYGAYRPFALLKRMIEKRLSNYDGDWSVYVKNLKTDESFVVNDQPMKSASVMKLFIMGTVYKAIEAGELERTEEVVSLLNSMISASDNEASNRLLYLLGNSSYEDGIARVDEFIREYGFSEMTVEYNGFNNSDTVMDPGHNNQVSAKDCGRLLEDVYRRSWMNRSTANEIEQMMLNQHTRYKIPAGLPEGVSCGNKTGEMDATENDAAVVYGKDCDYILVILSSDWNSKDEAVSRIASMSGMVYRFLN